MDKDAGTSLLSLAIDVYNDKAAKEISSPKFQSFTSDDKFIETFRENDCSQMLCLLSLVVEDHLKKLDDNFKINPLLEISWRNYV